MIFTNKKVFLLVLVVLSLATIISAVIWYGQRHDMSFIHLNDINNSPIPSEKAIRDQQTGEIIANKYYWSNPQNLVITGNVETEPYLQGDKIYMTVTTSSGKENQLFTVFFDPVEKDRIPVLTLKNGASTSTQEWKGQSAQELAKKLKNNIQIILEINTTQKLSVEELLAQSLGPIIRMTLPE